MTKNVGKIDGSIRYIIATVIVALYLLGVIDGPLAIGLGVFAGIMVLTSLLNLCPIYMALGIRTCPADKTTA